MMEAALRTRLLDNPAISALVGNRIAWVQRPQSQVLPAITLHKVSPGRSYSHDGAIGLQCPSIQFDIWSLSVSQAKTIRDAVIAVMEAQETVSGVRFGMSFLDSERDIAPEDVQGIDAVHRVSMDFTVWWSPA